MAGAPVGVVIITPDPKQRWWILFDAGQAAAYMQLAAWELGVGSCLATIYATEEARDLLNFPPDWEAHVGLSLGYPAEPTEIVAASRIAVPRRSRVVVAASIAASLQGKGRRRLAR